MRKGRVFLKWTLSQIKMLVNQMDDGYVSQVLQKRIKCKKKNKHKKNYSSPVIFFTFSRRPRLNPSSVHGAHMSYTKITPKGCSIFTFYTHIWHVKNVEEPLLRHSYKAERMSKKNLHWKWHHNSVPCLNISFWQPQWPKILGQKFSSKFNLIDDGSNPGRGFF